MADNRFSNLPTGLPRETVCIETNRVLDSCRDRDCFENVRVYLSDFGNEILDRTGAVRAKSAEIVWCNIGIDSIPFNRGFYAVNIRFYVRILCEVCVKQGRPQEVEGMAVLDKRVILYGGESGTVTFRSNQEQSFCTPIEPEEGTRNLPTAVIEAVDPVLLGTKIVERQHECCCCCCQSNEIPERIMNTFQAPIHFDGDDDDNGRRYLAVSLGIFSVIRITRPAQYLIQAAEYAIPEKECRDVEDDNPCHVFRKMPFPMGEFTSDGFLPGNGPQEKPDRRCGCGNGKDGAS